MGRTYLLACVLVADPKLICHLQLFADTAETTTA
jgi:hypothetical protein